MSCQRDNCRRIHKDSVIPVSVKENKLVFKRVVTEKSQVEAPLIGETNRAGGEIGKAKSESLCSGLASPPVGEM